MLDLSYMIPDMTTERYDNRVRKLINVTVTNPYSGQSAVLTPEEHKLYTEIKQAGS